MEEIETENKVSRKIGLGAKCVIVGLILIACLLWWEILPLMFAFLILMSPIIYLAIWWMKKTDENVELERGMERKRKLEDVRKEKRDFWEKKEWCERRLAVCDDNLKIILKQISEINNTLGDYYALDIVYWKYRNFFAVSKLFEYIESGRCLQLSGPNGAYNVYENEVRMDTMIDKMDIVIKNMEEIRTQNAVLYNSLNDIQYSLNKIGNGLYKIGNIGETLVNQNKEIIENTYATQKMQQIEAYNAQRIAEYAEYQAFALKQRRLEEGHWN